MAANPAKTRSQKIVREPEVTYGAGKVFGTAVG